MTVVSKKPEKRKTLQRKINAPKSRKQNWLLKCFSVFFETQLSVAYWNMHWVSIGVTGTNLQCIMISAVAFHIRTLSNHLIMCLVLP